MTLQDARYQYRDACERGTPFDVERARLALNKLEPKAKYGRQKACLRSDDFS